MGLRDSLRLPKILLRKRSKARSEIENTSGVGLPVPCPTESSPDLQIGASTLSLNSRDPESNGMPAVSFQRIRLTIPYFCITQTALLLPMKTRSFPTGEKTQTRDPRILSSSLVRRMRANRSSGLSYILGPKCSSTGSRNLQTPSGRSSLSPEVSVSSWITARYATPLYPRSTILVGAPANEGEQTIDRIIGTPAQSACRIVLHTSLRWRYQGKIQEKCSRTVRLYSTTS